MLVTVTLDLYIVRTLFVFGQIIPRVAEECKGDFLDISSSAIFSMPLLIKFFLIEFKSVYS